MNGDGSGRATGTLPPDEAQNSILAASRAILDAGWNGSPHPGATNGTTGDGQVDPNVEYAVHFLTYAYTVPFRLVALQQELSDVFSFVGVFDTEFMGRWASLSPPEQAAFSQSYREYRRMQALGRNFAEADRDYAEVTLEERAGRFVAAHMDGLDQWQEILRGEAAAAGAEGESVFVPEPASLPAAPRSISPLALESVDPGRALLTGLNGRDSGDVTSALESLAPIDEMAREVMEKLCANEMADAQRRFLARVRWLLSLPNQQRVAVALRTIGKKRKEIAAEMGISEESVKTHLSRADDDWDKLPETDKTGLPAAAGGKANRKRRAEV